ncbi:Protein CBG15922 [Caenorhabditis briggsae]|uniref:Uncharacterized protein n=2 Tax=Caenorhabditis briggsae TaxID=6238 RepID=A0AAE9CTE9_CAEBR|nr:Protein CBG15922 [Caenorhabditis briggsae]ULT80283.1 hypothetical protein L3Y34_010689 [Caenorhabditis briggsae]CAP34400.1 Protein CBG15922 [Caenorhabditis briggsae]
MICFWLLMVFSVLSGIVASPMNLANPSAQSRFKRATCESKYGEWSDWGDCSMNCGYCGKQNRTRTCAPVNGCNEPICDGDSMEIQSCGTSDRVCLYPSPSCCSNFKKTINVPNRRSIVVQKMQLEVTRFQQDQRPLKPNDQFKRYIHCKKWQQFFCI